MVTTGIIRGLVAANERWRCVETSSLIGWAHTHDDLRDHKQMIVIQASVSEPDVSWDNLISIVTVGSLAPCVARSWRATALPINYRPLGSTREEFGRMIWYSNTHLHPLANFQHAKDWIIRILFPDFAMIIKSVTLIIPPTGITLLVPSGLNMLVALSMSTCHHNQLLNEQLDNEQVPGTPGPKWDARKYMLIFHQRNHNRHHLGHPRCRRMWCFCEFKVQFKTLHVAQITRIM